MRKILMQLLFVLLAIVAVEAKEGVLDDIAAGDDIYVIKLENGDVITGKVVEFIDSPEYGPSIRVDTEIGVARVYEYQIEKISKVEDVYRHAHRHYLLPSAVAIGSDHYAGMFEVAFMYAGFGIGDMVSVNVGRSILPGVDSRDQISVMNAKVTLVDMPYPGVAKRVCIAVGGNLGFVNHNNRIINLFANGTIRFDRTAFTAALIYKQGSGNSYRVRFNRNVEDFIYEDGNFGVGLGLDTKFSTRYDLHFIGEIWTPNIRKPLESAVLVGLRLCNDKVSSDFGLAVTSDPFAIPFVSFVWTPFN